MPRKIKQYKPIGFGDRPDPDTVEGHLDRLAEAKETRLYKERMKEIEAEKATRQRGMLSKIMNFFSSQPRRR